MLGDAVRRSLRAAAKAFARRSTYKFWLKDWTTLSDITAFADAMKTIRFSRNLEPLVIDGPKADRLLVLAPHPDDESIGIGGTLAKYQAAGGRPTVIFVTSGRAGQEDIRIAEARQACRELSAEPVFLGYPAGRIPIDAEAVRKLADAFNAVRPQALFVPFFADDNDDHRRVNELLLEAARSRTLNAAPEIWAYQVYSVVPGNVMVDITENKAAKVTAIAHYQSELSRRDWINFALGQNAFNSRLLPGASEACWAEAFFVVPFSEYIDLLDRYFADANKCYYALAYRKGEGRTS